MTWLFASGHAVDIVIGVMLVECVALLAARRGSIRTIALTFGSGMLILLGLRAALTGAHWSLVALPLALSFPAHVADLWSRGLLGTKNRGRPRAAPMTSDQIKTSDST